MNNTNIENVALKFVILLILEYNIFKNFGNWIYKVEVRKCSNLVKYSLPKLNGFEVLKKIRSRNIKTPVLLLTARDGIEDRVQGLDFGADDYLIKPFAFDELLARIRVLLRRNTNNASNVFTIANLSVNCDSHEVYRDKTPIKLSTREFTILEYMIRNKEKVLPREKIEQHIWDYNYEGGTNVVDVYIRYLRKKIDDNFSPKLIHTIRGIGYILKVDNE